MLVRLVKAIDRMLLAQPADMYESQEDDAEKSLDVIQLEERVMYSAVPFIDPAELANAAEIDGGGATSDSSELTAESEPFSFTTYQQNDSGTDSAQEQVLIEEELIAPLEAAQTKELIFVAPSIDNISQVVDDLLANHDPSRYLEIVYLDPTQDLSQVYGQLPIGAEYDSIHFLTHGTTGGVQIGDTLLTNQNIAAWAGQIATWGNFLSPDGDILFYGCDLASEDGAFLVDTIASLTGADVAASDDLTGHAELGGDWEFEYFVGAVETDVVISEALQATWQFTLDISSNLVAHYEFEENGGTTLLDSTGNQNGTLVNTATWTSDDAIGDYALDFSGDGINSNSYVEVTDNAAQDFGSGDWTVSFWYNLNGTPSGAVRLLGDYDDNGAEAGFLIFADNLGDLNLQLHDTGVVTTTDWISGTYDGTWQHVALTFDSAANTVTWYSNGTQVNTTSFTGGSISSSNNLRIGASATDTGDYEGKLDDVRLYTRELSSTDVTELYTVASTQTDLQATGTSGGGLSLNEDGGNDTYLIADDGGAILGGLSSLTVETQFTSTDNATENPLISYNTSGDNRLLLHVDSAGDLSININGINRTSLASTFNYLSLFDGSQHSVAFTWDNSAGNWEVFVDGVSVDSGTGLASGLTIDGSAGNGTIVFGQEQDTLEGNFSTSQVFSGTLHDVRIFSDVRTADEIAASYKSDLPYDEAGLLANWRFNDLSSNGIITEEVSGNNLTVKHTSESGFTASEVSLTLQVDENAVDGTIVGTVDGTDAQRDALIASLLAADPDLVYSAETGKFYKAVWGSTNWSTASASALTNQLNGVDGQLANIRSTTEQEIAATFSASGDLWIGATDATVEGEHRWTQDGAEAHQFWSGDGSGHSVDGAYSNWLSGRPDNTDGNQHYTFIRSDGYWNEEDAAHTENGYLVEWDADEVLDANQALTYSIQSQTVTGAFEVDSDSGEIRVLDGTLLDYETNATHTVTFRITDVDSNTYDRAFTISLNNLVEANSAPTNLSSGIELNTDGGNDAYLLANDGSALLGGLTALTIDASFTLDQYATGQSTILNYFTSTDSLSLSVKSSGELVLEINNAQAITTSPVITEFGQLYSASASWDNAGNVALYVDGQLVETFTGISTSYTMASGGQLVIAQDQDSLLGNFGDNDTFNGTLYDLRIWNEVRSEAEVALNHQQKLDTASLPSELIANWQMDGFNGSNEVVDVVSGNNLSIGHAPSSTPPVSISSWSNELGGVTASGSTITYVDATGSDWGTASINSADFSSYGFTDNYTVAFQIDNKTDYNFMIGLGETESGIHYSDIEHAMFFDELGNDVEVFRNGVSAGQFTLNYLAGDEFSFYVNGTTIEYQHNGTTFYTATGVTPTSNWYIDSDFNPGGGQDDFSLSNFRLFNGNVESSGSATFTTSTPVGDLHVEENATNGTTVGYVLPSAPDSIDDIASDGLFNEATDPATYGRYSADGSNLGSSMGDWNVTNGYADLLNADGTYADETPLGGNSVHLFGGNDNSISQTLSTEAGKTYQVTFAVTGNWNSLDPKHLRVSAGGESHDFFLDEPPTNWDFSSSMQFEHRTFTFTADSNATNLSFTEMLAAATHGSIIADVQVVEIPHAVNAILNNDSTLSYDAATGKFYQLVTSGGGSFQDALDSATAAALNGVSGQLVTILSDYENELVRDMARSISQDVWIGASDQTTEGDWYWLDGANDGQQFFDEGVGAVGGSYQNWIGDNPTSTNDAARMRQDIGEWETTNVTASYAHIVEWDASEVLSNYTFSLTDDASGRFAIDSSTGEITVADSSLIDYETATSHNVTVEVTDAAGNTYSESMAIAVDNEFEILQTVPSAQSIAENTTLTFSNGTATEVSVSDTLPGTNSFLQLSLSVNDGVLNLAQTTGLTFVQGSNGTSNFVISGTESDLNAALNGMTFTPDVDFAGSVTLTMDTSLSADLDGHYTFEGGNSNDQSIGTTYNGTMNGDANTTIDGTRGEVLSLDGSGDFVQISGLLGQPANLTLAGWINATGTDTSGAVVISMGGSPALYLDASGYVEAFFESGGTNNVITDTTSLVGTGWRHVAMTIDDTTREMSVYIDGQRIGTITANGPIDWDNSPDTYIGRAGFGGTGFDFNGMIDDARIYSRSLSAEEIAALANDQTQATDNVAITVTPVNEAPILQFWGSDQQAMNDGSSLHVDAGSSAILSDVDSPDFNGGSIQIAGGSFDGADLIGIDTTGSISLSASLANGSIVSVSGVAIGTLSGVTNDGFTLSLNSDSTIARVQTVLQEITFSSTSTVFGSRTVDVTLIDGDGTANGGNDTTTVSSTINLSSSVNGAVTINEDTTYTYLATDFDFTGVVGNDLREITITSLPTDGLLQLNSVTVTVGQTITKAQIDGGQLTYTPNANQNGTSQATFNFHVNSGNQSLNILTGEPSAYSLNSTYLTSTDAILLNGDNFGVSGTNPTHLQFESTSTTIDAAYLSHGEIYFGGYVADGNLDASELAAIESWVNSGGVLISTSDSASYDSIAEHFGLVIGGSASATWHIADTANTIINGDFGSVGNAGDPISASGTISYFDSASLAAGDLVVATDSVSGEPTIVLRQQGDGWILFTSDEGIFRTNMTGDGTVSTPNDILAANIFAWAADSATPNTQTMEMNVAAVNDGPSFELPGEVVNTDGSWGYGQNQDMAVLSDGSVIVTPYDSGGDSVLLKLNADGTVDTTFGTNGYADNTILSAGYIQSIEEQADGKLLVSGRITGGVFVARYNADGTVDTTFGTSGITTIAGGADEATDIAIQSDGSILIVGEHGDDSFISRLSSSGVLDGGFGTSGITTVNLGGTFENLESVTVLGDGSIIAVGETSVVKLTSAGALDTGFDTDGILDLGNNAFGVALQADGKFVVTGGTGTALFVTRFNADGSLDTDFGTGGTANWATVAASGYSIAQQADGKLVVAGFTDAYPTQWVAVRFNTDGNIDNSFATNGAWVQDTSTDYSEAYSVSLYNDGTSEKIVIGGYTTRDGFDNSSWMSLVRLNHDGSLDATLVTNTLDGNPTFTEGGSAVVLDADVQIFDQELSALDDFNGATLTLVRNGSANTQDVFSSTGSLGALVEAGNLTYGGTTVGTVTTNSGGTLVLTFNSNATNTLVNSVMQAIAYSNSSDTPPASVQIDWTFDDNNSGSQGSGGALQATGSTTIDITAVNDTPSVTGPGAAYSATEQTNLNIHGTGFSVTDVDAATGTMTATLVVGEGSIALAAGDSGVAITANNASTVTFTGTLNQINNLLTGAGTGNIVYNNGSDTPAASTTITLTVNDGGNTGADPGLTADGTSEEDSAVQTINITATNDNPTDAGSLPTDVTVTEDVLTAVDFSSVDFSDVDAGASDLTVTLSTSTGGQITLAADATIDFGGTATVRTLTGTLAELNAYFNNTTNIQYLHGTAHTFGNDADTITVVINDNGNTGTGGGTNQTLGVVNVDITAVNDAPVASGIEGTPLGYTENDGAVAVSSTITFADLDDTHIESAQVSISSGYNSSEDVLMFVNQNGISGSFNPVSGIWSLTGSATLAEYETAIRSITYENVSDNPDTTTRTVSFTVNDGDANSNTLTRDISITATNDAPTISDLAADTLVYTEGDGAQVIDQGTAASAVDVDSTNFDGGSLVVRFTAGSDTAEDILSIQNQGTAAGQIGVSGSNVTYGGITIGTFSGGTSGVDLAISLNASADDAATTALLQAITYENTDTDNPTTTSRTVRFVLSDGDGGTSTDYDATVTVAAVNDAATITGLSGDQLNYAEGDGVQRIEQLDDVSVSDIDSANFDTGTLTVSIAAGSDAAEDVISIIHQGTGAGQIGVSGSTVTYAGTTIGTFTGGSGGANLVITLNANTDEAAATALIKAIGYENTDTDNPTAGNRTVRFVLNDGDGGTSLNQDTVVAVSGVNDDPVNTGSLPTDITVTEDVLSNIDLSAIVLSDADHSGGNLTITLTTGAGNLTATSGGGVTVGGTSTAMKLTGTQANLNTFLSVPSNIRYLHPKANTYGDNADSLSVQVTDNGNSGSGGGGDILLGVVNIDISGVNDDPTNAGTLPTDITVNEDILSVVDLSAINLNDVDHGGGALTLKLNSTTGGQFYATSGAGVTVIGSGSTSLWLTGDLTSLNAFIDVVGNTNYQHSILNTAGNDADTFSVSMTDNGNSGSGGGGDIALGNVNVDITGINDAPVVTGESYGINEDTPLAGNLLANDYDPESDPMTAILVSGPANGSLSLNTDGTFNYTPGLNFHGTDQFVYNVTDGSATSIDATATITVAPVNDKPVAVADTFAGIAGEPISISNVLGLLNNDGDVDGDSLSVVFIGGTFDGILALNPDGSFTYTPPVASLDTVVFTYAVTDGTLQSDPVTVSLTFAAAPLDPDPHPDPGPDPEPETDPVDETDDDDDNLEELIEELGPPITTVDELIDGVEAVTAIEQKKETVDAFALEEVDDDFRSKIRRVNVRELDSLSLPGLSDSRYSRLTSQLNTLTSLDVNYEVEQLQIVLDDFDREVKEQEGATRMISGTVSTFVLGATAGTAIWMTSSSYLVAMLSSTVPAWAGFDPVYVVQSKFKKSETDDQSLADLIRQGAQELGGGL